MGNLAWAYSAWHEPYIEQLRDYPVNYQVEGAICEQVARLELFNDYDPRRYEIEVNLSYGQGKDTLGELDIVVFEKFSGIAVFVAEVKCWTDPGKAQYQGNIQRHRFMEQIHINSSLWIRQGNELYRPSRFRGLKKFDLIGQAGARRYGFDRELRLNLNQLKDLRTGMLECQKARLCQGR